ncbi:MAG: right-handed parallel beta-helix repeat-containing protein [candidate division Zixibacteria bacterium]|nr:right-handed parallel beta-helix repeat-containing protein [candidate division Zixibacteria bacterium]
MFKYLFFIGMTLCFLACPGSIATVIHVPVDQPTIQAGINAASEGDTVLVDKDEYKGEGNRDIVFLGKAITVRSEFGPDSTIINCEGLSAEPHVGFIFENNEDTLSVLKGFKIINGFAPIIFPEGSAGGAIICYEASPRIDSCLFQDNTAQHGGGIMCYHSAAVITRCVFIDNTAFSNGGGMLAFESTVLMDSCLFYANFVSDVDAGGGGLAAVHCDSVKVSHCSFESNTSEEDGGGALFISNDKMKIDRCVFYNNTCFNEGGGALIEDSDAEVVNTVFTENFAYVSSGGLMCEQSRTSIANCTFVLNEGPLSAGVSFWDPLEPVTIENTLVTYNYGSPITTDDTLVTFNISCCDFFDNSDGDWFGFFAKFENIDGNFSEDPIFCNTPGYELNLNSGSPCAPANNDCGTLIGALEVGCSCCIGFTGNADCSASEDPDITDITAIIDHLYLSHKPLCCPEEADTDGSGGDPDITDITKIIDYLYLSHTPLANCP